LKEIQASLQATENPQGEQTQMKLKKEAPNEASNSKEQKK
jgi:hypothetical protein